MNLSGLRIVIGTALVLTSVFATSSGIAKANTLEVSSQATTVDQVPARVQMLSAEYDRLNIKLTQYLGRKRINRVINNHVRMQTRAIQGILGRVGMAEKDLILRYEQATTEERAQMRDSEAYTWGEIHRSISDVYRFERLRCAPAARWGNFCEFRGRPTDAALPRMSRTFHAGWIATTAYYEMVRRFPAQLGPVTPLAVSDIAMVTMFNLEPLPTNSPHADLVRVETRANILTGQMSTPQIYMNDLRLGMSREEYIAMHMPEPETVSILPVVEPELTEVP